MMKTSIPDMTTPVKTIRSQKWNSSGNADPRLKKAPLFSVYCSLRISQK
jgi:hypothetical protein